MGKMVLLLIALMGISCNININLNFDPEKLEKAMDSFLDDIGYSKKNKKMPTWKLFCFFIDIVTLKSEIYTQEKEDTLEKIKKEMKEIQSSLEKYYNNHLIGEALDSTIKIIDEKKIKDKEELKELKSLIERQNDLRNEFFREFARVNGKQTQEAIEQIKEAFVKKIMERAEENQWCREEKGEDEKIKWVCE